MWPGRYYIHEVSHLDLVVSKTCTTAMLAVIKLELHTMQARQYPAPLKELGLGKDFLDTTKRQNMNGKRNSKRLLLAAVAQTVRKGLLVPHACFGRWTPQKTVSGSCTVHEAGFRRKNMERSKHQRLSGKHSDDENQVTRNS